MNALPPRRCIPPTFRPLGEVAAGIVGSVAQSRAMAFVLASGECDLGNEAECLELLIGETPGGLFTATEIDQHFAAALEMARSIRAEVNVEGRKVG